MKIKKYTTLIIILLLLFSFTDLWAQEEEQPADEENFEYVYGLGDQIFTIKAGLIFPLYLMSPDFNFTSTNLSMGGAGSLEWSAFINSSLALGGGVRRNVRIQP